MLGVLLPATPGSPASRVVGKLEVSGPHFIFGKIKVHVSQSRPAGTRKTLAVINLSIVHEKTNPYKRALATMFNGICTGRLQEEFSIL